MIKKAGVDSELIGWQEISEEQDKSDFESVMLKTTKQGKQKRLSFGDMKESSKESVISTINPQNNTKMPY